MIRRLTLSALLLSAACGDDPDPKLADAGVIGTPEAGVAGVDAGVAGVDAGTGTPPLIDAGATPPVKPNQVTSVGKECTANSACTGENPTCLQKLSLLQQELLYPGGYCTATCKDNAECGTGGECPVGESLKGIPPQFASLIGGFAPSNCYLLCTTDANCRTGDGYRCTTVLSALSEAAGGAGLSIGGFDVSTLLSGPIKTSKYCLPPAPQAPVSDAGTTSDAGSRDAGSPDAGAADASAASDAGRDAGTASDAGAADAADGDV